MRGIAEIGLLLFLASLCAAQVSGGGAAEIRRVRVIEEGANIKIELTLSATVAPALTVTTDPDRLVVDLPGITAPAKQRRIGVNQNGVKGVRFGLNSADPLVTRLVVDLESGHPYLLASAGDTITLTVLGEAPAEAANRRANGAVPAANGPLVTKLWPSWQREAPAENHASSFRSKASPPLPVVAEAKGPRTTFRVKYVAEGVAYLDGGRSSGLAEGMKLAVRDSNPATPESPAIDGPLVAGLQVVSVAATSAVAEIHDPTRDVKPRDWAFLSAEETARRAEQASDGSGENKKVRFLKSETRKPQRPELLPEDSRIQGRIGFDYSGIRSSGSTAGSSRQLGISITTNMTRIAGTYWNLQGYMHDRLTSDSFSAEQTMESYLDRTYILQLSYDNPNSRWVAGFGRLYLPWAVSLDTIDGGYVGRKLTAHATAGVFFGSTPDPTSWHYQPDQQMGGWFVNFAGGDYESFHYSSTSGVAMSMLKWQLDRPYLFLENEVSYRRYFSVYHSFIVDSPQGITTDGIKPGMGISRSYLTLHIEPNDRINFDIYHNYFRDTPTAATALIGTGLVDKLLYQGVSAGIHVQPLRNVSLYATVGQSDKTGDQKRSLNQMYGLSWNEIMHTGFRADLHYSKFDSSFARGDYRVLAISRPLGERIMFDAQVGSQTLNSAWTANHRLFFVDTSFDTNLGRHSFLQSGYTVARGSQLNYSQWYLSLGYRFNMKGLVK